MRRNGLLAAALAACAGAAGQPVPIALGDDACAYCHMTLTDERHAAQWIPATGSPRIFDEAGCLLHYAAAMGAVPADDRLWVKDEAGGAWVDARTAVYLIPERPDAGMMYGILAYRDIATAEAVGATGRMVHFDDLVAELRS